MRVRVVWWDLDGSATTIAALREIGREPDFAEWFDLEACVEGGFSEAPLSRRGAAFAAS